MWKSIMFNNQRCQFIIVIKIPGAGIAPKPTFDYSANHIRYTGKQFRRKSLL